MRYGRPATIPVPLGQHLQGSADEHEQLGVAAGAARFSEARGDDPAARLPVVVLPPHP